MTSCSTRCRSRSWGAVTVRHEGSGWVFGSALVPGVGSAPVSWGEVEVTVREFARRVADDLNAAGLDAAEALRVPGCGE